MSGITLATPLTAECVYTSNTEPEGYAGIFDATGREIAQVVMYGDAIAMVDAINNMEKLNARIAELEKHLVMQVQICDCDEDGSGVWECATCRRVRAALTRVQVRP